MKLPKTINGPVVSHVYPGEPADKAGLKPYDVILNFNDKAVGSGSDLIAAVTGVEVGASVPIKVWRGGSEKELKIKVAQRPGTQTASQRAQDRKKGPKRPTRIETGMNLEDITPEMARELGLPGKTSGVVVSQIAYGGPADKAGLLRGDVILEVDTKPVKDSEAFYSIVKEKKGYLLRVRRGDPQGHEVFSIVTLDLG